MGTDPDAIRRDLDQSPVRQAGRERVTFLQWYRHWLDEALRTLRSEPGGGVGI
jgi:hypothetical protein